MPWPHLVAIFRKNKEKGVTPIFCKFYKATQSEKRCLNQSFKKNSESTTHNLHKSPRIDVFSPALGKTKQFLPLSFGAAEYFSSLPLFSQKNRTREILEVGRKIRWIISNYTHNIKPLSDQMPKWKSLFSKCICQKFKLKFTV